MKKKQKKGKVVPLFGDKEESEQKPVSKEIEMVVTRQGSLEQQIVSLLSVEPTLPEQTLIERCLIIPTAPGLVYSPTEISGKLITMNMQRKLLFLSDHCWRLAPAAMKETPIGFSPKKMVPRSELQCLYSIPEDPQKALSWLGYEKKEDAMKEVSRIFPFWSREQLEKRYLDLLKDRYKNDLDGRSCLCTDGQIHRSSVDFLSYFSWQLSLSQTFGEVERIYQQWVSLPLPTDHKLELEDAKTNRLVAIKKISIAASRSQLPPLIF